MKANTAWAIALLLVFSAQVIYSVRMLMRTQGVFIEGAPQDFVDINEATQRYLWHLSIFATLGCLSSIAILRKPKVGWPFLATLLTTTSALMAITRLAVAPRYIFSADWPMAFALGLLAVLIWQRVLRNEIRRYGI